MEGPVEEQPAVLVQPAPTILVQPAAKGTPSVQPKQSVDDEKLPTEANLIERNPKDEKAGSANTVSNKP